MKKKSTYPNKKALKGWVVEMSAYLKETTPHEEIGTIFAFPSEAEDPENGLHEFQYDNQKCIHCGKKKSDI